MHSLVAVGNLSTNELARFQAQLMPEKGIDGFIFTTGSRRCEELPEIIVVTKLIASWPNPYQPVFGRRFSSRCYLRGGGGGGALKVACNGGLFGGGVVGDGLG